MSDERVNTAALVKQRRLLRRSLVLRTVILVIMTGIAVVRWVDIAGGEGSGLSWVVAVLATAVAVTSIFMLISLRRATRRFEAKYGRDAGKTG